MLALARYDRGVDDRPRVEELETGAVFRVDNGLVFRLHRRLRSRYQCFELASGREYRVHGLCRVEPVLEPPRRPQRKVGQASACRK